MTLTVAAAACRPTRVGLGGGGGVLPGGRRGHAVDGLAAEVGKNTEAAWDIAAVRSHEG